MFLLSFIIHTLWYVLLHWFKITKCINKTGQKSKKHWISHTRWLFHSHILLYIFYITISSCMSVQIYPFVTTHQSSMLNLHSLIQKKQLNGLTFCLFTSVQTFSRHPNKTLPLRLPYSDTPFSSLYRRINYNKVFTESFWILRGFRQINRTSLVFSYV